MKRDTKTHYKMLELLAAASRGAGAANSASIDFSQGPTATVFVSAGTFGASATLDAKLQHSADNSTWADDDGTTGNSTAITQMTAAGSAVLHVIYPMARYYRVVATVATAAVVCSVTAMQGPLNAAASAP